MLKQTQSQCVWKYGVYKYFNQIMYKLTLTCRLKLMKELQQTGKTKGLQVGGLSIGI